MRNDFSCGESWQGLKGILLGPVCSLPHTALFVEKITWCRIVEILPPVFAMTIQTSGCMVAASTHQYAVVIACPSRVSLFADKAYRKAMSCWCAKSACLIVGDINPRRYGPMKIRAISRICFLLGCGLLAAAHALAEPAWVSDQFEIMLRTGPSNTNAIQLMVSSGTQLEVLEQDDSSGYARVRTAAGTEGWVLSRYLMSEAPAREQLASLTDQLTSATSRGTSMSSQLNAIKREYDSANRQIRALENEQDRLQSELAGIKRTAANVLSIDSRNKELQQQLTDAEIKAGILEQENRELNSQQTRYWFMSGALVLLVGIILGFWLPRIRWKRRSRYDSF